MSIVLWIPAILAFFMAPRVGRNRILWAGICFVTSILGVIALLLLPDRRFPSVDDYVSANPQCKTSNGISCANCGSRSIRLWRDQVLLKTHQYHLCNSCGKTLYRS